MSLTGQMDKLVDKFCTTKEFYALYIAEKRLEEKGDIVKQVLFYERKVMDIEDDDLTVIERKRQLEALKENHSDLLADEDVEKYLMAKSAFLNLRRRAICYINRRIDDHLEILGLD